MTTPITAYTTADAVRGAIGLTDNEVTDTMLVDQNLPVALLLELDSWLATHKSIYAAGVVNSPTADAVTQVGLLRLFSMWWCASKAAKMVLAVPEKITDGKAEMKRFSKIDFAAISDEAMQQANLYKTKLQEELGTTVSTTSHQVMGSASPDYDPVTNEG